MENGLASLFFLLASGKLPFHIPVFSTAFEFFPLVMEFASAGKGNFQLYLAVF
jgi:hypothetical protein